MLDKTIVKIFILIFPLATKLLGQNYFQKGLAYFLQRKYFEAENEFSEALKEEPENPEVLFFWAQSRAYRLRAAYYVLQINLLFDQGRLNQARELLKEAKRIYPTYKGFAELALRIEEEWKSNNPLSHLSLEGRKEYQELVEEGQTLLKEGNYQKAMGLFSKALVLAPRSIEALEGYTSAQAMYREELYRQKLYDIVKLAQTAEKEKKFPLALKYYRELFSLDPQNTYLQEKINEIEKILEKKRELDIKKRLAEEYLRSANEYLAQNFFLDAMEQYRLGKAIYPNYLNWDELIQKTERAYEVYQEKLFQEKLKEISLGFERTLIYFAQENYRKAVEELSKIIEIADYYGQVETKSQALKMLNLARENLKIQEEEVITPASPYYSLYSSLMELGFENYEKQNYAEAQRYFTLVLQIFPRNRQANRYLILSKIKEQKEAKENIIQSLQQELEQKIKNKEMAEARRIYQLLKELSPSNLKLSTIEKEIEPETKNYVFKKSSPFLEEKYKKALSFSQNEPEKSIAICREILAENEGFLRCRNLIAAIEGRLAKKKWMVVEQVSEAAKIYYSEGLLHYNSGRMKEAVESFRKALEIEPNFTRAKVALQKCLSYLGS